MKAENAKAGMLVRHRKVLAFGWVMRTKGSSVIYVAEDQVEEALASELDLVATVVPILVRTTCPTCGEASNRKPFDEWVVERCPDCGEEYAAGPFQVDRPLAPTIAPEGEPC